VRPINGKRKLGRTNERKKEKKKEREERISGGSSP
jgi:hypothetical protein